MLVPAYWPPWIRARSRRTWPWPPNCSPGRAAAWAVPSRRRRIRSGWTGASASRLAGSWSARGVPRAGSTTPACVSPSRTGARAGGRARPAARAVPLWPGGWHRSCAFPLRRRRAHTAAPRAPAQPEMATPFLSSWQPRTLQARRAHRAWANCACAGFHASAGTRRRSWPRPRPVRGHPQPSVPEVETATRTTILFMVCASASG